MSRNSYMKEGVHLCVCVCLYVHTHRRAYTYCIYTLTLIRACFRPCRSCASAEKVPCIQINALTGLYKVLWVWASPGSGKFLRWVSVRLQKFRGWRHQFLCFYKQGLALQSLFLIKGVMEGPTKNQMTTSESQKPYVAHPRKGSLIF